MQRLNPFDSQHSLGAIELVRKQKRTVNVYNIDYKLSQKQMIEQFKQFGKIDKIWVQKQSSDDNNCCSILFRDESICRKALKMDQKQIMDSRLTVVSLYDQLQSEELQLKYQVVVRQLDINIHNYQVYRMFKDLKINKIEIIRNNQQNTSFCIVQFQDQSDYEVALSMDGSLWQDQNLNIQQYKDDVEQLLIEKDQQIHQIKQKHLDVKGQDYDGEILDIGEFQGFTKTNVVDGNYELTDDKNVIRVAPRTIRRKIKKVRQKLGDVDNQKIFKTQQEVKLKNQQKNDKELFNGRNEMEIRKKKRVQQQISNLKKQNKNKSIKLLIDKKNQINDKITRKIQMY